MKRYERITIIGIVLTGILVFWLSQMDWVVNSGMWQKAEGELIDRRYRLRGQKPGDTNIVIVGIENTSLNLSALSPEEIEASPTLQLMNNPFPWDRRVYAATLDKVMKAGAKVVVFDFLFPAPSTEEGDAEFRETLRKYPNSVVLASTFDRFAYIRPHAGLISSELVDAIGFATVWPDPDGVVRRGRYQTSEVREDYELKKFADQYPDDLMQLNALAVKKFTGKAEFPPYGRDNFIDFQGRDDISKPYVPIPIETLFVDKLWNNPPLNGDTRFRGKIVLVGPIAHYLQDVHLTPFGETPGPVVQAQIMATLLWRSSLVEPSPIYGKLLTLGMVLMAIVICLFASNALLKWILMVGTAGGFAAACQYAFSRGGMVVPMTAPFFGLIATGSTSLVLQFVAEQIERRRYRNVLDRYVSKNVAEMILAEPRSWEDSLIGQKKPVIILFSDIRGFTTMTEERDPVQLVKQLNEYFKEMVDVVQQKEKGTLSKFIGDAIMAAWGDTPYTEGAEGDARRAVRAALGMRAGLAKLNASWKERTDWPQLQIGIGLNHGEAIVGNIGSPDRLEFGVLGDVVNLAARLETATKQFHVDVLVGESVEALTREHFIFRRVGLLVVKGKHKPVEAFSVIGERFHSDPPWLARYHEAVSMFRNRQFEKAKGRFQSVEKEIGHEDFLCEMYVDWCDKYQQNPPPDGWAGNFVLTEK